jgi:hypothetical protein
MCVLDKRLWGLDMVLHNNLSLRKFCINQVDSVNQFNSIPVSISVCVCDSCYDTLLAVVGLTAPNPSILSPLSHAT